MLQTKQSLKVSGMHCASCASIIKRKLEKMEGVEECVVNVGTEKAQVVFDESKVSVDTMNKEIGKLGYALENGEHKGHGVHEGHEMMTPITSDKMVKEKKMQELAGLKKQVQVAMPMVLVSLVVMVLEMTVELPKMGMEFVHHLLPLLATYMMFVVGLPYLKGLMRFVKHRVANMDTLVGIGTLVAYLYSFYLSVIDAGYSYYEVVIVVIGFITLGKYLEARSKLKTGEAIEKLLNLQAKSAVVIRDGKEVEIPIEEVMVGDIMLVKPGQKIAVDGEIIEGASAIDESMITGESIPVDKVVGDMVIGATMNKQGSLRVRATKVGSDTMLAQIIKMVEEAQGSKAPIERLADQISAVFVPVVLVLSLVVLAIWIWAGSLSLGIVAVVGILVIACPCAMGLATPTAVIVGVGKAAANGILIKNAESLEKLQGIDYVVMDKTGTVTKGMPELTDIKPVGEESRKEILQLMASLETHSEHPLAFAIVERAKAEKIKLKQVKKFAAVEGKGLKGEIGGTKYFAGNMEMVKDLHLDGDVEVINRLALQGKTPVVLATEKKILAYLAIADTIKDEAKETVANLHKLGMKVAMLTGDNQRTAQHIADQVGIDKVIAEVLPGDKAKQIKELQEQGHKVAMVGDGINDAPALAMADVGIAMGTGTDVAIESAGITLLGGQIAKLPKAFKLAKATMRTIKQNLFWAFFYNIVGIPIAAGALYPIWGIMLNPAIAGGAMAFSSVSVVLNALRLKRVKI